jgi:hypothetical protein
MNIDLTDDDLSVIEEALSWMLTDPSDALNDTQWPQERRAATTLYKVRLALGGRAPGGHAAVIAEMACLRATLAA